MRAAYDHRLFYVLEQTGQIFIDTGATEIGPDTLIILPPATGYYFKGRLRVAVLNFDMTRACSDRPDPICPPPLSEFQPEQVFDRQTAGGFDRPCILTGDITLREAVLDIIKEFRIDEWSDPLTSARLKQLLAELQRRTDARDSADRLLCRRVMSYIRTGCASIRNNEELAAVFGYHPVYLGSVFKREMGLTLHEALCSARIQLARRLLTQTDSSIEEIATMTGFCTRSHFSTVFKAQMGVSPAGFRRRA